MRIKVVLVIIGFCGVAATLGYSGLPAAQARKTTDGVYTSAQADRGMQVMEDYGCRNCHGAELEGGPEEQPPLLGEQFLSAWTGRKLDELAGKITEMPADRDEPYHVRPAAAPDVVAYLLRTNGYPAGQSELPSDPALLKQIEMVSP